MFSVVMKCLKPIVPVHLVSKLQVSKSPHHCGLMKQHRGQTEFMNIVKACRKEPATGQLALQLLVVQNFKFNRNTIQFGELK